jgi:hypothetical protein
MNSELEQYTEYYLRNLYRNYVQDVVSGVTGSYKYKILGAMEALLIILKKLDPAQPFDFKTKIAKIKILWLFPIDWEVTETYEEFILRTVKETLTLK